MKSPINNKLLKNSPGQSLDEEIHDLIYDKALWTIMSAAILVFLAFLEWWRYFGKIPPYPWLFTFIAVLFAVYAFWKCRKIYTQIKRLRLGRDGERAVGQFLDSQMLQDKAKVFHDVQGEGFNLDHVVIHRTGIYVVETKTRSKPDKGECKIFYDGNAIVQSNQLPDNSPIIQARAAKKWLKELIKESTGRDFPIRSVVVYPGWFIEGSAGSKESDVWVLNPKALPKFISNSQPVLANEDVHLCAKHLALYVGFTNNKD